MISGEKKKGSEAAFHPKIQKLKKCPTGVCAKEINRS